jgi:glycosyltransferase involved in cell wall biosynthesis/predicted metal-dependent phosphoesterase TrpH
VAKVDMHCHSIHSDQPIHWVFRKLGARESYTPPDELYHRLKSLGMDFVTITDHNKIDGCLELTEKYDDTFISCEFTVNFLHEPAEIHLCAYDITEQQFTAALKLRHDIREFAQFFREENVLVSVPHPFHCNRGKLGLEHLEQVLLLFDCFEEINGLQMETANRMQREFFENLNPELFETLRKKYDIAPQANEPWKKSTIGGSDDHSSFFLGRCWTEVKGAADYSAFLDGIKAKKSRGRGQSMTALAFSHSTQSNWINAILDQYCKPGSFDERLIKIVSKVRPQSRTRKVINRLVSVSKTKTVAGRRPTFIKKYILKKLIRLRLLLFLFAQKKFLNQQLQDDCECLAMDVPIGSAIELESFKSTVKQLMADWRDTELLFNRNPTRNLQEETYRFISTIFNTLYRYSFGQWLYHIQTGNIPEAFAKLSLIIPGILPAVPYIMGYRHFFYDNQYLNEIGSTWNLQHSPTNQAEKWGWFTDTLIDVNGAAQIIRKYTEMARLGPIPITAITSHPEEPDYDGDFINFRPLFHFPLPEYESMTLAIPPVLDLIHHCEQQGYTRLIISSPGPTGLLGLWIANLLSIPVSGIYHTDLPGYTGRLTRDPTMEQAAWQLIRFFYGRMDKVFTLSEAYRQKLIEHGIDEEKIHLFAKGIDIDFFRPGEASPELKRSWNAKDDTVLLYVGRVSKEKDLDVLVDSYRKVCSSRENITLVIVGDGPYLSALKEKTGDLPGIVFTGFIVGDKLAEIYRSSDIFVFPSTTDTYGTVLLEAQSSGLPAIVSDSGGPKEVIVDGETGLVTRARNEESFTDALLSLLDNPALRRSMGEKGRVHVKNKSWQNAFHSFLAEHVKIDENLKN